MTEGLSETFARCTWHRDNWTEYRAILRTETLDGERSPGLATVRMRDAPGD